MVRGTMGILRDREIMVMLVGMGMGATTAMDMTSEGDHQDDSMNDLYFTRFTKAQ